MPKKITVTLTDEAEEHFKNVQADLQGEKGPANNSEVINSCLIELFLFQKFTGGNSVMNWLIDNYHKEWSEWTKKKYPHQDADKESY